MNKYKQALSALRQCEKYFVRHMFSKNEKRKLTIDGHRTETIMTDILFELVDRATPKKVMIKEFEYQGKKQENFPCGICYRLVDYGDNFCSHCRQAIDWSYEE